jgi:hypothetical protein
LLGEEHPSTLLAANNLASSLSDQAKYAEAKATLEATLDALRRVLGDVHPWTLNAAMILERVRSALRAEQPTKTSGKAAARRNERAAAAPLSPTALAEAAARASAAEAELLAMLDLEEPEVGAGSGSGSAKGKPKGQRGKR